MLGVSGTLKDMNNEMKNQLFLYDIKIMSLVPSIFGGKNVKFKEKDHLHMFVGEDKRQ